jgi:universal stress protein E
MMKRILAATDLSEPSYEALRQAFSRARQSGAPMAVCYVLSATAEGWPLLPYANVPLPEHLRGGEAGALRDLEQTLARVIPGAKPEIFVEWGSAYAQIVRRAESWQADLIVVGSRGATGLPRLLLGSVAERVVRHAHCKVLVARPATARGVVMAATDLSDPSLPAVAAGAAEATRMSSRFVLVHAIDFSGLGLMAVASAPFAAPPVLPGADAVREMRSAFEGTLRDIVAKLAVEAESIVLEGSPAAVIAQHAADIGAELLVVGTHGRTGLSRLALGSVAERLVRLVPCSVLAVRQGHSED